MPINTVSVGAAVTPTVISTYFSHYLNRKPLRQKPTAHITYHEGLELIRRFLHYASFHTVDDIQAFTSQWVPVPTWVMVKEIEMPKACLERSAEHIQNQLGLDGIKQVGGTKWWQWRRENAALKAEWIEMRKDYNERKESGTKSQRIMLYVHGGAYYFGSVDEHRYQMQRHARKLRARVLAPRYRLAPQFPFPCGLMDCLAAYMYLLEEGHDPSTIIFAGDSAGGGMVVSMLVILRDQGVPLPAGAILISPWVDLTHSFPSLGGDGRMDYIPAHGFVHKPSASWPPPNVDDLLALERKYHNVHKEAPETSKRKASKEQHRQHRQDRVHGFSVTQADRPNLTQADLENKQSIEYRSDNPAIGPESLLSITIDHKLIQLKDQIQLYAANHLITHPLVSPILQPTLGGLPPLLIQTGGAELLHDEQVYLAHKAASPLSYLPRPTVHTSLEKIQAEAARYRPTNVQLQIWDDLCHVAPTLSFTRPAKFMYRSIAQFGAWALARAQKTSIDILDDDSVSIISSSSSTTSDDEKMLGPEDIKLSMPRSAQNVGFESIHKQVPKRPEVGKAGDPLPAFKDHMIRQRIDRHGNIHELPPTSELSILQIPAEEIGVIKEGPVKKWMNAQKHWNEKFSRTKLKVQKRRIKDMEKGYEGFDGEHPPPTALAGRRVKGGTNEKACKKKSWGMMMWSLWGSKHDEMTLDREEKAEHTPEHPLTAVAEPTAGDATVVNGAAEAQEKHIKIDPAPRHRTKDRGLHPPPSAELSRSRSRSRHSTVTDRGQAAEELPSPVPMSSIIDAENTSGLATPEIRENGVLLSEGGESSRPTSPPTVVPDSNTLTTRPLRGGVAYPFKIGVGGEGRDVNASTVTLQSMVVATPPVETNKEVGDGTFTSETVGSAGGDSVEKSVVGDGGEKERPVVERFVTAAEGLPTA